MNYTPNAKVADLATELAEKLNATPTQAEYLGLYLEMAYELGARAEVDAIRAKVNGR